VSGGDLVISPGGKGANQAVAAALTGADVTMVGAVGSDRFAEAALTGLRRSGVDLARVRTVDGATGTALITVDAAGENTIIVSPGANGQVCDADAEVAAALLGEGTTADGSPPEDGAARAGRPAGRGEPAVLVLQGEIASRVVDLCVDVVRDRAHVRVLVNAAPVTDFARATLHVADPLVVNESEALLIARQIGASPAAVEIGDGAEAADEMAAVAAGLVEWGIPAVVLTLGAQGSLVAEQAVRRDSGQSSARVVVHRVESSPVRAVDTTGAGDMFVGALAAHLAEGCGLVEAARAAAVRAAASVEHPGAQSSYFAAEDVRTP
jgi:ribokinase